MKSTLILLTILFSKKVACTGSKANSSAFLSHLEPLVLCKDCVIALPSEHDRSFPSTLSLGLQKVYLNLKSDNDGLHNNELKKQKHLVTFYQGDNMNVLESLVSMVSVVDSNINILAGNRRPPEEILLKINRPFVWLTKSSQTKVCYFPDFYVRYNK